MNTATIKRIWAHTQLNMNIVLCSLSWISVMLFIFYICVGSVDHKWLPEFLQKFGGIKVMQMRLKKPKLMIVMSQALLSLFYHFFFTHNFVCIPWIWVKIHCCVWADLYATSEVLLLKVDSVRITGFCWYYWCRVFYCTLFSSWSYANVCFSFMCLRNYLTVLIIIWA